MRISDWSSDVCSSDLGRPATARPRWARTPLHTHKAPRRSARAPGRTARTAWHWVRARATATRTWYQWATRSEERRVGKECVSTCKSRPPPHPPPTHPPHPTPPHPPPPPPPPPP